MSATLTFREATPADVPEILPLVQSAYRGEESRAGWTTEADLVGGQRITADGILGKINEPDGILLLAHDDAGVLSGTCEILKSSDSHAYFGLFAVHPKRQAGGIGRQVLAQAEKYAKDRWGTTHMEMSVIWTREELISWYVRRGYKKTDRTKPFPVEEIKGHGHVLRDDLYFTILEKEL